MIRDLTLKTLFIPLLGLVLPLLSGLIALQAFTGIDGAFSTIFFLLLSFLVWQLTVGITSFIRTQKIAACPILKRLVFLSLSVSLIAAVASTLAALLWQKLFTGGYQKGAALSFGLSYSGTSLFIALVYEILFLDKEIELDSKVVNQLDLERQYAEMHVLKNELDPHFIFNSLTALSHLISSDSHKAQLFNNRLAQAYKYLLINKDRDLIALEEELHFIKDYFFLLQIRYDGKLNLEVQINEEDAQRILILPFALQLLVENAIKHNSFTDAQPLQILIFKRKNYLCVANNIVSKNTATPSMRVGLRNLRNRYRIICRQNISISKTKENFLVKLPLIKLTEV